MDNAEPNISTFAKFDDILTDSINDEGFSSPRRSIQEEVWRSFVTNRDAKVLGDACELGVATNNTIFSDDLVRFEERSVLDETCGFLLLKDEIFNGTRGLGSILGTGTRGHTPPHSIRILKSSSVDFFSTAITVKSRVMAGYSILFVDLRRFVRMLP
ncbi:hypothetical protein C450_04408 [Halococcus salifodinae DSM 8989]|uniref:Uncharacterized protein n=1 Tax=Halococcus salifodinae DSM 8989 TaxID=1227456 RepID=M0NCS3_9EURY|nr:hypothetical protein C450_04408 [Halococcus salifodinae DSM 8989]